MSAVTLAGAVLFMALAAVAAVDFRTRRIPDGLSLPLLAAGLGWTAWSGAPVAGHLTGAAAGYASLAVFGEIWFRRSGREGLGLGDAKLFAAGGAWLGWQALPLVLLTASVCGLAFALAVRRGRADPQIAFGPWLALGIWVAWVSAQMAG